METWRTNALLLLRASEMLATGNSPRNVTSDHSNDPSSFAQGGITGRQRLRRRPCAFAPEGLVKFRFQVEFAKPKRLLSQSIS